MASTKQSSQSMQASPWRHHVLVRLVPILALGVTAIYLNGFGSDDAQGRIGMDKLLNEPVLKDEPFLINDEPVLKETEQEEQEGVKNAPVLKAKESVHDSILLPMDPVATPSTKAAKAEGGKGGKGGKSKEKSKEKSKGAKAEGAKAEKHDGKSKGAKSASKSKGGKSKSKSKGAKAEGAKAEKHDGKAGKASAKGGKSKEKSKGGAKSEKKKSAKATTEKIALDVQKEMEDEEVEAEYIIKGAE
mmetsp:Transcript_28792/g.42960  ORF Transcript_28792/g.42960 Transcript_28792/m.42960 type:complete len:245 (-) Transcript_28792:89-823(-)